MTESTEILRPTEKHCLSEVGKVDEPDLRVEICAIQPLYKVTWDIKLTPTEFTINRPWKVSLSVDADAFYFDEQGKNLRCRGETWL